MTRYVRDLRWLLAALPAFGAVTVGYLPRVLDRLWASLRPWLSEPERTLLQCRSEAPRLLTRYFWVGMLMWAAFAVAFVFIDHRYTWVSIYSRPDVLKYGFVIVAPFFGYFVGGPAAVAGAGLKAFTPTLMDARFFIQVGTSMTAIFLANVLIRALLVRG